MRVTDVLIVPEEGNKSNRLASAYIKLDDMFVITDIGVFESEIGTKYITFPEATVDEGQTEEVCYPQSKALYEYISSEVLVAYEDYLAEHE